MAAYWSGAGWRQPPELPAGADLARLVEAGVMYAEDDVRSHDAFRTSLASRRLDLRSALGSWAVARHLPEHEFAPNQGHCRVCGLRGDVRSDRNLLSFERFKWGGVRRDDPTYVAHDLELCRRAPRPDLTDDDLALGRQLLDALAAAPADHTAL